MPFRRFSCAYSAFSLLVKSRFDAKNNVFTSVLLELRDPCAKF